jgi:hypothetical protein
MLDIHPPHEAVHTWKDFFIHIATICIGLLIAIGLEQTVEWVHRGHERREVVADLREEAAENVPILHTDIRLLLAESDWDIASITVLQRQTAANGVVRVTLPQYTVHGHNKQPARSAWIIASTNGKGALLPESRARVYEQMDRAAAQVLTATEARNAAFVVRRQLELRLHGSLEPGATLAIPGNDLAAVIDALSARATALQYEAFRDAILAGQSDAIAHDSFSPDSLGDYISHEVNAVEEHIGQRMKV